jgi:hypothetical protein
MFILIKELISSDLSIALISGVTSSSITIFLTNRKDKQKKKLKNKQVRNLLIYIFTQIEKELQIEKNNLENLLTSFNEYEESEQFIYYNNYTNYINSNAFKILNQEDLNDFIIEYELADSNTILETPNKLNNIELNNAKSIFLDAQGFVNNFIKQKYIITNNTKSTTKLVLELDAEIKKIIKKLKQIK